MIGITLGDPCGIGPEILLKSLHFLQSKKENFTIYCSLDVLKITAQKLNLPFYQPKNVKFKDVFRLKNFAFGKPSRDSALAQVSYLKKAVDDAKSGFLKAIVTLPINKASVKSVGFAYPGHTEFFAHEFGAKDFVMLFASPKLNVALQTIHVPLSSVSKELSVKKIVSKLKILSQSFSGTIGVCGLNPHAGENGLMGHEEQTLIAPAVKEAKKLGIKAEGPFPADTLFLKALRGDFEVILAMYHDQGLIPVKLTAFEKSTNCTLGLPVVRTSVPHGTAYDIAGTGSARPESFQFSVDYALKLAKGKFEDKNSN